MNQRWKGRLASLERASASRGCGRCGGPLVILPPITVANAAELATSIEAADPNDLCPCGNRIVFRMWSELPKGFGTEELP